jgi:hypothetical protein
VGGASIDRVGGASVDRVGRDGARGRADRCEDAGQVLGGDRPENVLDEAAPPPVDLLDRGAAEIGLASEHDAPVVGVADALDEAALLHPVEEAGGVRHADPQPRRKPAHRQRPVLLQNPQDLEMRQADAAVVHTLGDRAAVAAREGGDALGDPPQQLGPVGRQGRPRGAGLAVVVGNCSIHLNNVEQRNLFVNQNDRRAIPPATAEEATCATP